MSKRTLSQVLSIAFALSKAEEVGINEIKWLRNEVKRWAHNLISF
ncbi:hypothetical protein [Bacteriovorax sp. DB6_IX]|nr:hypothetical protein [Bacteriovorax sp. DB6_IX]EQC43617.1 hypothetical protein M901_1658 [Bacteriovorax sp. DB6_IX]